jgi:hypothetical protein
MRRATILMLSSATLIAGLPLAVGAETPSTDGVAPSSASLQPPSEGFRAGSLLSADQPGVRFGITLKSLSVDGGESDVVTRSWQVYGATRELAVPAVELPGYEQPVRRSNVLGLAWQHSLDAQDRVALSAEHGANVSPNQFSQDTLESRAVLSWTHHWGTNLHPSLTGSVFLGDEMARDESFRQLGRRYMGFAVGGQLTLAKTHTPYLAYQLRRSYYDPDNTNTPRALAVFEDFLLSTRYDNRSLLTAGYRWQAGPHLSLQAEASYGLNTDGQDLYNPERTRLFLGTRFDFR